MLRFIIRRQMRDQWNGLESEGFETVDIDVPELERILLGGGFSENGYDARSLLGVEVLPAAGAPESPAPLPNWEPCNEGCDPEFNGCRSRSCKCPAALAALGVGAFDGKVNG